MHYKKYQANAVTLRFSIKVYKNRRKFKNIKKKLSVYTYNKGKSNRKMLSVCKYFIKVYIRCYQLPIIINYCLDNAVRLYYSKIKFTKIYEFYNIARIIKKLLSI